MVFRLYGYCYRKKRTNQCITKINGKRNKLEIGCEKTVGLEWRKSEHSKWKVDI